MAVSVPMRPWMRTRLLMTAMYSSRDSSSNASYMPPCTPASTYPCRVSAALPGYRQPYPTLTC